MGLLIVASCLRRVEDSLKSKIYDLYENAQSINDLTGKEKDVFKSFCRIQREFITDMLREAHLDSLADFHVTTLYCILLATTEKYEIYIPEFMWNSIDQWQQTSDYFK